MTARRTLPVVTATVLMPADVWLRVNGYADMVGASFSHIVCMLCTRGLDESNGQTVE